MKKKLFAMTLALFLAYNSLEAEANERTDPGDRSLNWGQRRKVSFEELKGSFRSPDRIYAPFAFWFWDAPLDPGQIARMAEEMCSQGLNPGYAHPRRGLPREEWLSPLWFKSFDVALRNAEAVQGYLGYCDEYWWPSGRADGRVLEHHPELQAVSLRCKTFDLGEGDSADLPESFFTVAARHAAFFTKPKPRPVLGQWIWDAHSVGEHRTACFRRTVKIPPSAKIVSATLAITADNRFVLFVNGREMGENSTWAEVTDFDLAPVLRGGQNLIAVKAANEEGPCGLIFGLRIEYEDGAVQEISSDGNCRTASSPGENWMEPELEDSTWAEPVLLGDAGVAPWHLSQAADVHSPALIKSRTLKKIGEGRAFTWRATEGSWRVYSFTKEHHPGIDGGDVNYIDRRLPGVFISIVHEAYFRMFGERMGSSIPGVFVDNEGDYGYKIAWSDDLEREYRESKSRDIRLWMPLLLDRDEEGLWAKARWDWYDVVSRIYADSYLGRVSRWLSDRGMYCISNLWEESLTAQAFAVGDFFRAQRAVTLPGNDCLVHKALQVHDFKETQSVTEFENRRFQSEILGVAGWQMSPVLMKQAVNAVLAWGVSHIVPHGVNLNRKLHTIPYPPDWFTSNPYWRYFHLWTDFTRRASYINSHGFLEPDVLLLNPMDSVWALLGGRVFDFNSPVSFQALFDSQAETGEPGPAIGEIEGIYSQAIADLSAARIEYLIADRHYLREMRVTPGGGLVRDPFVFKAVVIPSLFILPLDAGRKIVAFAEAGGSVYLLGRLPEGSSDRGMGDPEMEELMKKLNALPSVRRAAQGVHGLVAEGAPYLQPQAVFRSGAFPVLSLHRNVDGCDFFWLANNTGERQKCIMAFHDARGGASLWDCETGDIKKIQSRQDEWGSTIHLAFKPYEAFWVVFNPKDAPLEEESPAEGEWRVVVALEGLWNVCIDPSIQPPRVSPAQEAGETCFAEKKGARRLAAWREWNLDEFTGFVDYRIAFELETPYDRLVLDLGEVKHTAEVWINRAPVGYRLWPPFEFEIAKAARQGRNEVKVRVGNLLCNAMKEYGTWGWNPPKPEDFSAGLFGPVVLKRPVAK